MFKSLLRDRILLILLSVAIFLKLFSLNEAWVERYYSLGIYPWISRLLRFLLGWIPFSAGDLLYLAAFVWLVLKTWKFLRVLARRQVKEYLSHVLLARFLRLVLWIYLVFNLFWGLNYNRVGIAGQLGLTVVPYETADVYNLAQALQVRLNQYAAFTDSLNRLSFDTSNGVLFREGVRSYAVAEKSLPFLAYRQPSLKPSIFTAVGHWFGFTGYYNPFTGEAQMKTTVPAFVKPFVLCHEIAHQLGYAKENEANLVAFLTSRVSDNPEFRYSAYYDVYAYAARDLVRRDTALYAGLRKTVHPQFRKDYLAYMRYLYDSQNYVEPYVSGFYDRYLKLNNQPKGKATYNEVVAWLIAYMKKYGREAL